MANIIINGTNYPINKLTYRLEPSWNFRETVIIDTQMTYQEAISIFTDDLVWFYDRGYTNMEPENMSDFNILGSVVKTRAGNAIVEIGKTTDSEKLIEIFYGGVNNE